MSVGHSTVYRKTGPTAKAYRRATMEARTEDIKAADSPGLGRRLLAEKEAVLHLLHPPRQVPKPVKQAEPDQIKDSGLRAMYERNKAEGARGIGKKPESAGPDGTRTQPPTLADQGVDKKTANVARNGSYAHGMSMAATLDKVCMRPDITWRGKAVAVALSAHWPHVRPSNQRLRLLTGHGKKTVERGLAELKGKGLLTWKRGKPRKANEYTCKWLSHRASQTLP